MSTRSDKPTWDDLPDHWKEPEFMKLIVLQCWEADSLRLEHLKERLTCE